MSEKRSTGFARLCNYIALFNLVLELAELGGVDVSM